MHSVRTKLPGWAFKEFKNFLDKNNLNFVIVGRYTDNVAPLISVECLCYAYSDKEDTTDMTRVILRYGSIEDAFRETYNDTEDN